MRFNFIHNDSIKTFNDVTRHVEFEEDQLHAEKPVNEAFISETKMRGAYGSKYKRVRVRVPRAKLEEEEEEAGCSWDHTAK
jgi:hypothetical protein